MSLYPSLEDMHVDKMVQTQRTILNAIVQNDLKNQPVQSIQENNFNNFHEQNTSHGNLELYPALGNFLGLELSESVIRENMPEYSQQAVTQHIPAINNNNNNRNIIAPVSGNSVIPASAQVNHNIRELILCKDAKGKVGLRVQSIDNGIFVCIVCKNSPAALAGLRFGDQILQLNGTLVSGFSVDKIHKMLKKSGTNNISVVVRDRPFERTITLLKSNGGIGFQFKNGKINAIVKDSTAAKNGVLTNHNLLEVNGQTVVAMKDKEILKIINESEQIVKITITPSFIYDHLVKKLDTSFLRGVMNHSIPDF